MAKRVWIIQGWQGTTEIFSQEVPCSQLPEGRVEEVLKYLVAKHGLSEREIISTLLRRNSKLFAEHLEVKNSGPNERWSLSCGHNPFFTARVEERSD
ncbi:hypothetical protein [Pseudomonas sp. S1(2024)]|uniref:hypothetical protein n=1 Tax=Pseudomonas sp. S1(2024) TaxID=3390191 RepID=UPI003978B508